MCVCVCVCVFTATGTKVEQISWQVLQARYLDQATNNLHLASGYMVMPYQFHDTI